jgi:hypothetical protein
MLWIPSNCYDILLPTQSSCISFTHMGIECKMDHGLVSLVTTDSAFNTKQR